GPRRRLDLGHGGDARQGFAAKTECDDGAEVGARRQLARRVAGEGEGELVRLNATAVVDDPDEAEAAAGNLDFYPRGAGVEGVLDQLLDGGGRPFDYFARGDA